MKRLTVTGVLAIAILALTGCSPLSGASSLSGADSAKLMHDAPVEIAEGGARLDTGATEDRRQVITTGELSITVDHPRDAADEASRIVEAAGGRVDERTEHARDEHSEGSAHLVVRIPSAQLNSTLAKVKELGSVQSTSISSNDVTTQARDLDARIAALRISVDRLQSLMAKATSTEDLIAIEKALSERQGNLESMEAQQRDLQGKVDLATIGIGLESTATAQSAAPGDFLQGLETGWNALVAFVAGALVVFGVLLPWIALLGIVAIVVLVVLRRRRISVTRSRDTTKE